MSSLVDKEKVLALVLRIHVILLEGDTSVEVPHQEAIGNDLRRLVGNLQSKDQFWAAEHIMQLCSYCQVRQASTQNIISPYLRTDESVGDVYVKLAKVGFLLCLCEGFLRRGDMKLPIWQDASNYLSVSLQDFIKTHTDMSLTDSRYYSRWKLISLDQAVATSEKSARMESWISRLNRLYQIAKANDDKYLMRTIKWRLEGLSSRQNSRLGLTHADLVPDTIYKSWAEGRLSIGQGYVEETGSYGNLQQTASFEGNRFTLPKKLIVCCDGESGIRKRKAEVVANPLQEHG